MRKITLAVFLLGCLTGALATKLGAFSQAASAQTGPAATQAVLGPGLYVFQNRLDRATCGDASGSGFVNSYVAAVNGIPGSVTMHMDLPDSQFWPDWELNVTSTGHVLGVSAQAGVAPGPDRGDSHFDLTFSNGQFTGRGARSYMSTVNGQRRRCTVEFDTLLRRLDR
ncbi:MAG: hypothetical protein IPG17_00905 [Sandaracinaceae bacterium]|jgi:hypothetical protein|nr:hypothetical protein [Sandaracinaceae bacterium]MBK6813247.1 hypothetical protein [Sandaracinaceae bacterium]MBK7153172.1 hypothetical protein [Sandaracinaceae bacterium]